MIKTPIVLSARSALPLSWRGHPGHSWSPRPPPPWAGSPPRVSVQLCTPCAAPVSPGLTDYKPGAGRQGLWLEPRKGSSLWLTGWDLKCFCSRCEQPGWASTRSGSPSMQADVPLTVFQKNPRHKHGPPGQALSGPEASADEPGGRGGVRLAEKWSPHPSLSPAEVRSSTLEVGQSVWTWECHKQLRQGVHMESAWPDHQAEGCMRGSTPSSSS